MVVRRGIIYLYTILFVCIIHGRPVLTFAEDQYACSERSQSNEWLVTFSKTPRKFLTVGGPHLSLVEPNILRVHGTREEIVKRYHTAVEIRPNCAVKRKGALTGWLRLSDSKDWTGPSGVLLGGRIQPAQNLPTGFLVVRTPDLPLSPFYLFPAPFNKRGTSPRNPEYIVAESWDHPASKDGLLDIAALTLSDEPTATLGARLGIKLFNRALDNTFHEASTIELPRDPNSSDRKKLTGLGLRMVDLDGNGADDLVTNTTILWGEQSGEISPQLYNHNANTDGVAIIDVNRDKLPDIIQLVPSADLSSGSAIEIWYNQGNRKFRDSSFVLPQGWLSGRTVLRSGDINGDGLQDLIIADLQSPKVAILAAQSDGSFVPFDSVRPNVDKIIDLAVGDMNHDNIDDVVLLANSNAGNAGRLIVVLGNGTSLSDIRETQLSLTPAAGTLELYDNDLDDNLDIYFASEDGTIQLVQNRFSYFNQFSLSEVQSLGDSFQLPPRSIKIVDDKALSRYTVTLLVNGQPVLSTTTDRTGKFQFAGISDGNYEVLITKVGTSPSAPIRMPVQVYGSVRIGVPISRLYAAGIEVPTNIPSAPAFSEQWGLLNLGQLGGAPGIDINVHNVWSRTRGDANVIVGVMDGLFDLKHPSFSGRVWTNKAEIAGNKIDDDGNGYIDDVNGFSVNSLSAPPVDPDEHATHVAGIIGANPEPQNGSYGVAPNTSLLALDVFGGSEITTSGDLIEALKYAFKLKRDGTNIRVINASVGETSPCSEAYRQILQSLDDAGVVVVAAAGNESVNNDVTPSSPANCDVENVISVAALTQDGRIASFSNYGARTVHLAAPGENILSTLPNQGWGVESGTSQATPFVTGVAALLAATKPDATAAQIRTSIVRSARRLSTIPKDKLLTQGMLDANGALNDLLYGPPPTSRDLGLKGIQLSPRAMKSSGGQVRVQVTIGKFKRVKKVLVHFAVNGIEIKSGILKNGKNGNFSTNIKLKGPFKGKRVVSTVEILSGAGSPLTVRGPALSIRS